jgi:hypothetical protein
MNGRRGCRKVAVFHCGDLDPFCTTAGAKRAGSVMAPQRFVNYAKAWRHFSLPGVAGPAYDFPIPTRKNERGVKSAQLERKLAGSADSVRQPG